MTLTYKIKTSGDKFFWQLVTEENPNSPSLTSIEFDTEAECTRSIEDSKKLANDHNFEFICTAEGFYFSQVTFDKASIARSPLFANRLSSESSLHKLRHYMRAFIPKITNESVLSILSDFICLHASPLLNSYTKIASRVYSEHGALTEIKFGSTIFDSLPQSMQALLYDKEFIIQQAEKKYIVIEKLKSLASVYWHSIIPSEFSLTRTFTITNNDSLQNIRVFQYLLSLENHSAPIADLIGKSFTCELIDSHISRLYYIPTSEFSQTLIKELNELEGL